MVALLKMPNRFTAAANSDRRVFARKDVQAEVQGKRMDHSLPALQQPKVTLTVRDLSLGGLSAISPMPLQHGELVAVTFPSQGTRSGWDAVGRVLRCSPSALGYRIALEFDPLLAA